MGEKLFDQEFFAKLNNLAIAMNTRMTYGIGGGRKSNAKGNSVEFSDFREYRLGDDIRRIDWNAYGRFDKLFVKLFMEEKEGLFQIFLDASKSMDFGEKNKSVCAQRIAFEYWWGSYTDELKEEGYIDNGQELPYKIMLNPFCIPRCIIIFSL